MLDNAAGSRFSATGAEAVFPFEIVTPEGVFLSSAATLIELPTCDGQIGVMAGHQRLATAVEIGEMVVHADGSRRAFLTGAGFARVTPQRVSIMVSSIYSEVKDREMENVFSSALEWMADVNDSARITAARRRAHERCLEFENLSPLHSPSPAELRS